MYLFMEFCSAAKVYLLISILILLYNIIQDNESKLYIAVSIVIYIAISFGLNKICSLGYKTIIWFLVFFLVVGRILFIKRNPNNGSNSNN